MIVLGIDTSGYINAVGVISGNRVLADNRFPARTDTLEQIVDNIDVTLKQAGVSLKDVEGIGVGLGPGSWTGIKVGVTVGKMLAFSTAKPVAGIPTLDALAYSARNETLPVYAVIGAGVKDMIYAARYHFEGDEPVREGDYYVGDIRGLIRIIRGSFALVGPNANHYKQAILTEYEPAGYKAESGKIRPAGSILHNDEITAINEPARTRDNTDISQHNGKNGRLLINEPVGAWTSDRASESTERTDKNEPAQAGIGNEVSKSDIKSIENEPAGAWVAHLAMLRLKKGMGDNPQGLTPMYLKESTARVFINKYSGNKG